MLPKRLRLKDASLFQKAFRGGKPFFFGSIVCKALFTEKNRTLVGFAVSKKAFPRAVDRNRVKRMLSEPIQHLYGDIPDGWNLVFSLRGGDIPNEGVFQQGVAEIIKKISDIKIKLI